MSNVSSKVAVRDVEAALERLWIAAPGATLRREERRKAELLAGLLDEIARAARRTKKDAPLALVDAAAGKAYVGLLAAELVLAPAERRARVVAIEREPPRVEACRAAAARLSIEGVAIELHAGDVGDAALWPEEPAIAVALHACGGATDDTIDRAVAARARHVLVMPCCVGRSARFASEAERAAEAAGIPRHAGVRRAFVEAWIAAERTLRLEAAGYETEVVPLVAPAVTSYNLLFRARRVLEPVRMGQAAVRLQRMLRPILAD